MLSAFNIVFYFKYLAMLLTSRCNCGIILMQYADMAE